MRISFAAAACLALAVFVASPISAATPTPKACQSPAERAAENVRQLQTAFMVAALKCRNHPDANLTDPYNAFVRKYSNELLRQSNVLQGYFKRQYGGAYLKRFDTYITQLANEVSRRSQTIPQYCQSMRPVLAAVMSVEPKDLGGFDGKLPQLATAAQSPKCAQATAVKTAAAKPAEAAPAKAAPAKTAPPKTTPAKSSPAKTSAGAPVPAEKPAAAKTAEAKPAGAR